MLLQKTKVLARVKNYGRNYSLLICETDLDNRIISVVKEPLIMCPSKEESIRPTLDLTKQNAQLLMDELWNCGLRPTQGKDSSGELYATQKHLKDMRAIVSKKLSINF